MNFLKNSQTNWKYILIVVILTFFVGGGILWFSTRQEVPIEFPEIKKLEKKIEKEMIGLNLTTTKLATIPEKYATRLVRLYDEEIGEYEVSALELIKNTIEFSPDGRQVVYIVLENEKLEDEKVYRWEDIKGFAVVVNGKEGKRYDSVSDLKFSSDSKKLGYRATEGNKTFLVVNDEENKHSLGITEFTFSPDGQLAYGRCEDDKCFLVVNGVEERSYDHIQIWDLTFSPNSQKLAYVARDTVNKDKCFVVINGKESKVYEGILPDSLTFSPDGQRLAYFAFSEEYSKTFLVADEKEGKSYDYVHSLIFSSDGQKLAYVARKRWLEEVIILDGEEYYSGKKDQSISSLTFSPDSQRLAYVVAKPAVEYKIVVDNKEGKTFDGIGWPTFSSDGKHLAYVARRGDKEFIVIDEKEGKYYDKIWHPKFSSDGKYIVYGALSGNELWWIADGVEEFEK